MKINKTDTEIKQKQIERTKTEESRNIYFGIVKLILLLKQLKQNPSVPLRGSKPKTVPKYGFYFAPFFFVFKF